MKKPKGVAAIVMIAIMGFVVVDCSMQKVAERHEGYTRTNLWAYYLYTDSEIHNAPRIAEHYYFTFTAQDGSQPQESSIVFGPGGDIALIREYLSSLGYISVKREGLSERWERDGEHMPYYIISRETEEQALILTRSSFNLVNRFVWQKAFAS